MIKFPQNESLLPPYAYLMQVLLHCPISAFIYVQLWKDKNKENKLVIHKDEIQNTYLISRTRFKNNLQNLVREGLINIDERPSTLEIELLDWNDEVYELAS